MKPRICFVLICILSINLGALGDHGSRPGDKPDWGSDDKTQWKDVNEWWEDFHERDEWDEWEKVSSHDRDHMSDYSDFDQCYKALTSSRPATKSQWCDVMESYIVCALSAADIHDYGDLSQDMKREIQDVVSHEMDRLGLQCDFSLQDSLQAHGHRDSSDDNHQLPMYIGIMAAVCVLCLVLGFAVRSWMASRGRERRNQPVGFQPHRQMSPYVVSDGRAMDVAMENRLNETKHNHEAYPAAPPSYASAPPTYTDVFGHNSDNPASQTSLQNVNLNLYDSPGNQASADHLYGNLANQASPDHGYDNLANQASPDHGYDNLANQASSDHGYDNLANQASPDNVYDNPTQ